MLIQIHATSLLMQQHLIQKFHQITKKYRRDKKISNNQYSQHDHFLSEKIIQSDEQRCKCNNPSFDKFPKLSCESTLPIKSTSSMRYNFLWRFVLHVNIFWRLEKFKIIQIKWSLKFEKIVPSLSMLHLSNPQHPRR